jgi:pectate lyase
MIKYISFICVLLLPLFLRAQDADAPIGWASLNGGTTGGAGGDTVRVNSRSQFVFYAASTSPYVIILEGTIPLTPYERVPIRANKTVMGAGSGATLLNGGIEIKGNNVIVRNLRITGSYDGDWDGKTHSTDAITVYGQNVWIDHCDLSASADGLLDIRSDGANIADYITISWTRLSNHNKVMLFGAGDDEIALRNHLRVTLHHCWFDGYPERGMHQRMPRVRFGDVHVLNNFFDDIASYCVAARFESDLVVESNYFRNSKNPHNIEDQGKGIRDPELVAYGNVYDNSSGAKVTGGIAFNPEMFYTYQPDDALLLPAMVMNGAGLFDNPDNLGPEAMDDVLLLNPSPNTTSTLDPLENDVDPDGGELRISALLNFPRGNARILENQIRYVSPFDVSKPDTIVYQVVDTQGGIDTAVMALSFGTMTSIRTLTPQESGLSIYPNPAKTEVYVTLKAGNSTGGEPLLELLDLQGRKHPVVATRQSGTTEEEDPLFRLDVSDLNPGLYFIRVYHAGALSSAAFNLVK